SSIWVVPVKRPAIDAEDARLELARRFLRWLGPATTDRFAWWAGIEPPDARATWQALGPELVTVDLGGERRFVLASDLDALEGAEPVEGVRLIPHADPLIKTDAALVVPDERRRFEIFPQPAVRTDFWPVAGAVLVGGAVAGSWARQRGRVTVNPWKRLSARVRDAISDEALSFPIAGGRAEVRWTS
ncbi:MAG: DNA glycosylase AlkZ-like family protein, partial [Candidatus Binatia bacterium]